MTFPKEDLQAFSDLGTASVAGKKELHMFVYLSIALSSNEQSTEIH